MAKSLKALREEYRQAGVFYTPPELAKLVRSYLEEKEPKKVYDPTCGVGGLVRCFSDKTLKYGQDIDADAVEVFNQLPNSHGVVGDVLKDPQFKGMKFKSIVANPPFSVKWNQDEASEILKQFPILPTNSRADFSFLLHIWGYLDEGGTAVTLNSPGIGYRGQREQKLRQYFIDELNAVDLIREIPGGKFEDTAIPTLLVVLKKGRQKETIRLISEKGQEATITRQQMKEEGYSWSVRSYIEPPREPKEIVDPVQLEKDARKGLLETIEREVSFSRRVCEIDKSLPPVEDFIKDIKKLLDRI